MFRVPSDPETPAFDDTFKVSFWRWLTSSKADRRFWRDQRNDAARTAGANQRAKVESKRDVKRGALKQTIADARAGDRWGDKLMRAHEAREAKHAADKAPEDTP